MWPVENVLLEGVGRCMEPRREQGDKVEGRGNGGRKIGVCHVKNTKHPGESFGAKGICPKEGTGALPV